MLKENRSWLREVCVNTWRCIVYMSVQNETAGERCMLADSSLRQHAQLYHRMNRHALPVTHKELSQSYQSKTTAKRNQSEYSRS